MLKRKMLFVALSVFVLGGLVVWLIPSWGAKPELAPGGLPLQLHKRVSQEHLIVADEIDSSALAAQLDAVVNHLQRSHPPQLAQAVKKTMLLCATNDVTEIAAELERQGRRPRFAPFQGEPADPQAQQRIRRAHLVSAKLDVDLVRVVDYEMDWKEKSSPFPLGGGMVQIRDEDLDFLRSVPSPKFLEVLIPGAYTNLRGNPQKVVFGIGLVWKPDTSEWVIRSLGWYGPSPYAFAVPLL